MMGRFSLAPPSGSGKLRTLPDTISPRRSARFVRARHAASLIVLRSSGRNPEMLMGIRGAGHRFMPNRLVFPGGAVDPADMQAPSATPLSPLTRARLERGATPSLAHGIGVAAARELEEETGLSLGSPPALDGLTYLCRLVTPTDSPVRFNARFLLVEAAHVAGALAGSGELEALRFYSVEEALTIDLAGPTRKVIEVLQAWLSMGPPERERQQRVRVFRSRWQWE
jgi:8-oxo-dGTP pyrophosphatase MutT (NUDIX family)